MAFETQGMPLHLVDAVRHLVTVLQNRQVSYALIGGLATGLRSRLRFTNDADFLLQVPQIVLPAILEELRSLGFSFDDRRVIQEWVTDHMTVLHFHEVRVDWLKPALPLYQHVLDHASTESWLDMPIRMASPEGLILTKLIAFRPQDQIDIESLVAANLDTLDVVWIAQEWSTVAELTDSRYLRFQEMVAKDRQSMPTRDVDKNST
jgi:hypothetical protein